MSIHAWSKNVALTCKLFSTYWTMNNTKNFLYTITFIITALEIPITSSISNRFSGDDGNAKLTIIAFCVCVMIIALSVKSICKFNGY